MDIIEQRTHARPRSKAYSSSETPPPVAPRKDSRSLGLRRYNSSNVDNKSQSRSSTKQPYESEYEKLNRMLRHSLNAKSRSLGKNGQLSSTPEPRSPVRPRSRTKLLVEPVQLDDDIYLSDYEIASLPQTNANRDIAAIQKTRSLSPLLTGNHSQLNFTPDTLSQSQYPTQQQKKHDMLAETAIYGVAQGKGLNLVMELKELQKAANMLYKEILNTSSNSPEMADLRKHLRCGDEAPTSDVLEHIHATLQPPKQPDNIEEDEKNEIYLIDFKNCFDKNQLREKMMQLFTTPGPPAIAYQKITAKLDTLIYTLAEIVVKMRVVKNETIKSPYHVQCVLQETGHESDQLVKVLQNNELWIRWGTETGLPPLHHIYMLKYPPSYGMRKSIVMSMLAEKSGALKKIYSTHTRPESLIPPIYSKLESENGWQVTEFDKDTQKFESRETTFPSWIDECGKLATHLQSTHRTKFKLGDHIYALYSVYMIVIKDITLTEADYPKENRVPSSHQIYIGSSSTGVLYRFLNVENSHCDNMTNVLEESSARESYRCQHDYELVEACLALAWVRRQPRAVFVINSFQEGDMENMSLNKKKPFHDKMISLKQHYVESKKIGPANDMRYGMNPLGDRITP